MKNLSKLAVCAAVLFGMCGANGMLEICHCEKIQLNQQPPKVQENKAEANSAEVKDQVRDQAKNQAEDQENAWTPIDSIPPLSDNPSKEEELYYYEHQLTFAKSLLAGLARTGGDEESVREAQDMVEIYQEVVDRLKRKSK